jgi:hypothetical protein
MAKRNSKLAKKQQDEKDFEELKNNIEENLNKIIAGRTPQEYYKDHIDEKREH